MRFAEKGDFPAVRALWETCFPDEGGFNDYFFAHFYKEKYTLLYLEGETLVAMVQMLPYRMTVGGLSREATYIYGACTDPAHRRKGYMARLLERSFELDREAGRIASVLIPAEKWLFDFYKPFGYEPFFHISRREITCTAGEREAPRRLTSADVPALAALYDKLVPKCRIERDTAYSLRCSTRSARAYTAGSRTKRSPAMRSAGRTMRRSCSAQMTRSCRVCCKRSAAARSP